MKHVDPMEGGWVSPGYAHQLGVPLRGVTVWGCNLRGLFSAHRLNLLPYANDTVTLAPWQKIANVTIIDKC